MNEKIPSPGFDSENENQESKENQETVSISKERLEHLEKVEERVEDLEGRVEFISTFLDKFYKEDIIPFKNRMMRGEESDEQLVKDLIKIAYTSMDLSFYISNHWTTNKYCRGNLVRITSGKEAMENNATKFDRAKAPNHILVILKFLKVNYGIDHIDHLIGGYDINEELKK